MSQIYTDVSKRHDFVTLIEVKDCNPNGDPDADNMPRVDPHTMHGLMSSGCFKRKIRDYVEMAKGGESGYKIYIQNETALNTLHERAYNDLGIKPPGSRAKREITDPATEWMCRMFYDVRMFGAVMTTGVNAGQVTGPIQVFDSRTVDPITPIELTITRKAVTKPSEMEISGDDDDEKGGKANEMGRKYIVPYAIYVVRGTFNPFRAKALGVSSDDLRLFWDAILQCWDLTRTSSKGEIHCKGLYIFSHSNQLGRASSDRLYKKITLTSKVETPRSFDHYDLVIDREMPDGVTLTELHW